MLRLPGFLPKRLPVAVAVCILCLASRIAPLPAHVRSDKFHLASSQPTQETGFLNRRIELHGVSYRFQVYLPEEWRRDDRAPWPIILFLHGRGERGSEGMWQTQTGLPQAIRDHPDRWPFIVVLPQCPLPAVWTDPEMLAMAMAALEKEETEFHTDPERTYLTGISMGGYGAWELARLYPHRWAATAIAAGGIFWSYAPERWQQASTLPGTYARAVGRMPVWLFHGTDDPVVSPRESELMFTALKAEGGRVRLWLYQGYKHDCWTRAFIEPELPRWLLAHRLEAAPALKQTRAGAAPEPPPFAERLVIPFHPPALKLTAAQMDALAGEYCDARGHAVVLVFRQGDALYEKNQQGEVAELGAETANVFFYVNGSALTRLTFERDREGRAVALTLRDDRHEERWEKRMQSASR